MTTPSHDEVQTPAPETGFAIRWRLIFAVLVVWCAYIAFASTVSRSMSETWVLVTVLGALTASFSALSVSHAGKGKSKLHTFAATHKETLRFMTISFSLATLLAGAFAFYFVQI